MPYNGEWKSFDFCGSARDVFALFKERRFSFFLDSSLRKPGTGRYCYIGVDPFDEFICRGADCFERLREKFVPQARLLSSSSLKRIVPFSAGLMGFAGYECGLSFEGIKTRKRRGPVPPDGWFGFYDCIVAIDQYRHKLYVTSSGLPEKDEGARKKRARERLASLVRQISPLLSSKPRPARPVLDLSRSCVKRPLALHSNLIRLEYTRMVLRALDYIRRGEIYQVNLAQRFSFFLPRGARQADPFEVYEQICRFSPSCYGGYFNAGDYQIISSSPELFLRLKDGRVWTRPMKGTRARGTGRAQDRKRQEDLLGSGKDRAELLMITDLMRNDLGRVCRPGSVRVEALRTLEKYSTVFQTTSTVRGALANDKDAFDLLKASFPGGSISGCPKIRALQVIEELEPSPRGIYTGSMGYLSFWQEMEMNILIRSLLVRGRRIEFHVGGGIVADSLPEEEYEETLIKARGIQAGLAAVYAGKKK